MSGSVNHFSLVQQNWWPENDSNVRFPYDAWNRAPRPLPYRPSEASSQDSWRMFEDRVRTGPYRLNGFPSQPHSPFRIIVLNDEIARSVNPRLRRFIQESPRRIRGQWNAQRAPDQVDETRLTQEDRNKALMTLQKQIYNPYYNNKSTSPWSLYSKGISSQRTEFKDGKSCTVCLEDFVPKEEVVVTPCKHMFHEDCIVPWMKSHSQCPVCRAAIGDGRQSGDDQQRMSHVHNNRNATVGNNEAMTGDLISLIRAMEEAFAWVNVHR